MPKNEVAYFASLRSDLIVVEHPALPRYVNGREVGVEPGKYHEFREHRCTVTGKESIAHMRQRANAADSPGIWEMNAAEMPEVTELLAELATAETDRVREILRAEREGPERRVIVDVCERILQRANVSERRPGEKAPSAVVAG